MFVPNFQIPPSNMQQAGCAPCAVSASPHWPTSPESVRSRSPRGGDNTPSGSANASTAGASNPPVVHSISTPSGSANASTADSLPDATLADVGMSMPALLKTMLNRLDSMDASQASRSDIASKRMDDAMQQIEQLKLENNQYLEKMITEKVSEAAQQKFEEVEKKIAENSEHTKTILERMDALERKVAEQPHAPQAQAQAGADGKIRKIIINENVDCLARSRIVRIAGAMIGHARCPEQQAPTMTAHSGSKVVVFRFKTEAAAQDFSTAVGNDQLEATDAMEQFTGRWAMDRGPAQRYAGAIIWTSRNKLESGKMKPTAANAAAQLTFEGAPLRDGCIRAICGDTATRIIEWGPVGFALEPRAVANSIFDADSLEAIVASTLRELAHRRG